MFIRRTIIIFLSFCLILIFSCNKPLFGQSLFFGNMPFFGPFFRFNQNFAPAGPQFNFYFSAGQNSISAWPGYSPFSGFAAFPNFMGMGTLPMSSWLNSSFNPIFSSSLLPVQMSRVMNFTGRRNTPVINIDLGQNNRLMFFDSPLVLSPLNQPNSFFVNPITGTPTRTAAATAVPGATPYFYFEDPITCAGGPGVGMCHLNKFTQWDASQHSRSWTGDFTVAQYYELARPYGDLDPTVAGIKIGCVACHSPTAYYALGEELLINAPPRPIGVDNAWTPLPGADKTLADRGIFCDLCHTISAVGTPPVNFNFSNDVSAAIDPKRGPALPFNIPGVAPHGVIISPLHDDPMICGTCHDEIDPFGQLVKGTYTEWLNSPYFPGTRCQDCHQLDPLLPGPQLYSMNFKGAFSPWLEGTASVVINAPFDAAPGQPIAFSVIVTNELAGHYFPSGSEEERQLWLHVTATDAAGNFWHIPITVTPDLINPANPNHEFWVTTNAIVAWPSPHLVAIERDSLPPGDRIYHSIFISPPYTGGKITYAQYYADQIFTNRLRPFEPREEVFSWIVPQIATGTLTITADINYRRMPDSMADFLKIARRPVVLVNRASAIVNLI